MTGHCAGDGVGGELSSLTAHFGVPFERVPRICSICLSVFGQGAAAAKLDEYSIEILAEIICPAILDDLLRHWGGISAVGGECDRSGCFPAKPGRGIGDAGRRLVSKEFRISVDSFFNQREVEDAVAAGRTGAELQSFQSRMGIAVTRRTVVDPGRSRDSESLGESCE